jgi:broad specificity phosphatase PhoE
MMNELAEKLSVSVGSVTYTIVSAHIFTTDFKYFAESGILSSMYAIGQVEEYAENMLTKKCFAKLVTQAIEEIKASGKQILAIRHAKTSNNINRIYQGGELTANDDIDQSVAKKESSHILDNLETLKDCKTVFVSKYLRTSSTYAFVHNKLVDNSITLSDFGKNIIESSIFNEFHLGSKDGTEVDSTVSHLTSLNQYLSRMDMSMNSKYNNQGESIIQLFRRVYLGTQLMLENKKNDGDMLIVGHGTWLSALQILLGNNATFSAAKPANLYVVTI